MVRNDDLSADTLAVVLAGGQGARLGALTRHICKPALPFAAAYRNIDFTLSNCVNSGIRRIGVATQYKPETLVRHLEDVWSTVARRRGEFVQAWPAETRAPLTGYRGTADAVFRNLDLILRQGAGLVLVLAGDHVYQMDYRPMLAFHRARRADATIGCIEVPAAEARQFGVLTVDSRDRIERFVEKPKTLDDPYAGDSVLASMGIYVFETSFLSRILTRDAAALASRHDFGGDILPELLGQAALFAYPFRDSSGHATPYWRDVGTPSAYLMAHLELLDDAPALRLDDERWPIRRSRARPAMTADVSFRDAKGARRSLIAQDCMVSGLVHRSVLFPGARVGSGSIIEDSVILPGAVVGRNCRLRGTIVNSDCEVPDNAVFGANWSRGTGEFADEPVVLTADDFAADQFRASA